MLFATSQCFLGHYGQPRKRADLMQWKPGPDSGWTGPIPLTISDNSDKATGSYFIYYTDLQM